MIVIIEGIVSTVESVSASLNSMVFHVNLKNVRMTAITRVYVKMVYVYANQDIQDQLANFWNVQINVLEMEFVTKDDAIVTKIT